MCGLCGEERGKIGERAPRVDLVPCRSHLPVATPLDAPDVMLEAATSIIQCDWRGRGEPGGHAGRAEWRRDADRQLGGSMREVGLANSRGAARSRLGVGEHTHAHTQDAPHYAYLGGVEGALVSGETQLHKKELEFCLRSRSRERELQKTQPAFLPASPARPSLSLPVKYAHRPRHTLASGGPRPQVRRRPASRDRCADRGATVCVFPLACLRVLHALCTLPTALGPQARALRAGRVNVSCGRGAGACGETQATAGRAPLRMLRE